MTSGRRAKQTRRAELTAGTPPSTPRDDDEIAFYLGWAPDGNDEQLEKVKEATTRELVKLMGRARTSEVEHMELRDLEARTLLNELTGRTRDEGTLNVQRRLRGLLREYDGILVMARATGRKRANGRLPHGNT